MCGIAGFLEPPGRTQGKAASIASAMAAAMKLRGPDSQGVWCDPSSGMGLAFARLAIIDLSPAGNQPMVSSNGRFVIVYNGEVYNAEDVRRKLRNSSGFECPSFRGHSDTEVILEACAHWGVEKTVEKLIGMFAFALWDRREKRLVLARDRLGIKPLYWTRMNGSFLFGSDLKPLRQHPAWDASIDRSALAAYFRLGYVPAPASIFKGVHKLEPGHLLVVESNGEISHRQYWSLREVARQGIAEPSQDNESEMLDGLHDLLMDAVERRMVADVPLGAFLSGGIDSSTVVSLMQARSGRPVKTFSIGTDDAGHNEAEYAKAVARHLGTDHSELYLSARDVQAVVPNLAEVYDEPFADSSQIPTYLVSKLARRQVTVALSGDGGDELFAGYNRYQWLDRVNRQRHRVPAALRRTAGRAIQATRPEFWDRFSRRMPAGKRIPQLGMKAHKMAELLEIDDELALFQNVVSIWKNPGDLVPGAGQMPSVFDDSTLCDDIPPFMERLQVLDGLTYLPDDILTKVDRASMAVSLEARVPLIDHRVVEFAFALPRSMRIRNGTGKWALRQILSRYVPAHLFDRPKSGFSLPIGEWLRGDLRDWCETLLSRQALEDGLIEAEPVRNIWERHLSGKQNHEQQLWTVLMWQQWKMHWDSSTTGDTVTAARQAIS